MSFHAFVGIAAVLGWLAPSAWAAADSQAHPPTAAEQGDLSLDTVTVTAQSERPPGARPETTLRGEPLRMQIGDTLGRTLEQQMGVHNASFGPGVGVPVIRGLTGSRIRTLQDGIGSHDAAAASPDHAVTLEPLLADEITVLKGPAVVRYGGGAIGGAVNVSDNRIPLGPPPNWVRGATELRYNSNGDEKAGVFKVDLGRDFFALHLDGFYRERNDLRIPGSAIDMKAFARERGLSAVRLANPKGYVPNTDLQNLGGTVGWSISGDRGLVGMAVNRLENRYGIPAGGHGLGHFHPGQGSGSSRVRLDLAQTRYDFKAEWYEPVRSIEAAKLRIGLVDYAHSELDAGVRSTTFRNDVLEGRFELPFRAFDLFSGTAGLQWMDRFFSATGTETFAPPTHADMLAGFFSGRLELGDVGLELGLRKEYQDTRPAVDSVRVGGIPNPILLPNQLEFSPHSVSGALDWKITPAWTARLGYGWFERAPDIQELLSTGPHLATATFDVGNVALTTEASRNLDLGLAWQGDWLEASINGFYNDVSNYIYQGRLASGGGQPLLFASEGHGSGRLTFRCAETGTRYCLPVYGYSQADAGFLGYETEMTLKLGETAWGAPKLSLFSDYVRGQFEQRSLGNVPRLPPLRYGGQVSMESRQFNASLRLTRVEPQDRPGLFETETRGFLMLNLAMNYRLEFAQDRNLLVFLRADNLLDQEVRNAVSFLRNVAPEPGRSFEIGLRASF